DLSPSPEYLEAAASCIAFIERFGFRDDGRMWYRVTREGSPLRMRRYLFTECFACAAFAAYAEASGDASCASKAVSVLERILHYRDTPGMLEPKEVPGTRPARGFALPMILLNVAQTVRRALHRVHGTDREAGAGRGPETSRGTGESDLGASGHPAVARKDINLTNYIIDESVELISRYFVNESHRCVLEQCGPDGELLDHFEGRLLNPGHAIEGAWFLLEEAAARQADSLLTGRRAEDDEPPSLASEDIVPIATRMLDWMWEWGWDREYGGLLYFRDAKGIASPEYWHDMKFWWPHTEAMNATLRAYDLTGESSFLDRYLRVKEWTYAHFPDREYGEWFGYLHRDGSISSDLKGTMFKGPFHIPRMLLARACRSA
ncbi:MAG: AGE family epimerase/isomerase, partial [Spirochaetia bacterium]